MIILIDVYYKNRTTAKNIISLLTIIFIVSTILLPPLTFITIIIFISLLYKSDMPTPNDKKEEQQT